MNTTEVSNIETTSMTDERLLSPVKTARVSWYISADVECPHCEHENDFMANDEWWTNCQIGENKDFDYPQEMTCDECGKEFEVNGSDY